MCTAVAGAIVWFGDSGVGASSGGGQGDVNQTAAKGDCRQAVREQLVAPSAAEFRETRFNQLQGGTYRVSGELDAQNAFGAMLRQRFFCDMRPPVRGSEWEIDAVRVFD